METFALSKPQIDKFSTCMVSAIVTGNIAFSFVENPHLMEAMTTVGALTITRKQVADRWIPWYGQLELKKPVLPLRPL
jgi:hypothetical protein